MPLAVLGILQVPLAEPFAHGAALPATVAGIGQVPPPADVGQLRGAWPQSSDGGWGSGDGVEWPQTADIEEWELVP
jgi:hypothetical protein